MNKKYFYFLDKKYSDVKFKGELYKNILPLFNQYAQNGTNKPDDRAEVYLLMAKALNSVNDKQNAQHFLNEAKKLNPSSKEINDFLKMM